MQKRLFLLLQNFVENFSEFSAAQRNAGKHVTIMSELSRLVDTRTLMQVCVNLCSPSCCLTHMYEQCKESVVVIAWPAIDHHLTGLVY